MLYKKEFDTAKKYWRAFWEKELIDRPPVCITAPKKDAKPVSIDLSPAASYHACMNSDTDRFHLFEKYLSGVYYGGEAIPTFDVTLGPDLYAAFLGCKIEAGEGFYTTWSHPIVQDWEGFEIKTDKAPGSYYDKVKTYMEKAAAFGKDKFLVNMLDLHSNMDALSALRGPQDLCIDLMDYPEEVHRVLNDVRKTYQDIFNMAYQAGDMEKRGSTGWAPTYCESGRFAVIQCDFSCMISPAQAREFVIPAIEEESAFLDHCVYHYDGKEALGHIDDILAITDIDCIQWVPGEGNPRSIEWMDLLKKIQKAGKSVWIYDWTIDEIKKHYKELEINKVVFSVGASSQDEADSLLEYLSKNT